LALLASEQDRRLLCTAIALTGRGRRRLSAWSLPDPRHSLHERLHATMLGLPGDGIADRALRYMVEASVRGHHVPVRRLSHESRAFAEQSAELQAVPEDSLLVTGWSRGEAPPDAAPFAALIEAHPGPVLVVMDAPIEAFSAALLVAVGKGSKVHAQLATLAESLEYSYPCWTRQVDKVAGLEPLLKEVAATDLVIVAPGSTADSRFVPLLDRLRSAAAHATVAVLLPAGEGHAGFVRWLGKQSDQSCSR
jgi:hypothetical protein